MHISSACLGPLATNGYLIELDSGNLLIDPAEDGPALQKLIGGRSIDWVVLTHGHFDHIGGAWAVPEAKIAMHRDDLPFVDQEYPDHDEIHRFIQDGDELLPGVETMHLPGHSPGSIALKIEDALFVGDVLFAGSIGRTDLPSGSMKVLSESLRRLINLPGDFDVYPGHGDFTTLNCERQTNPYLRMMR
ncbi:MBL fold metallo-hydrolase [Candidatus Bipolaricaulota bacterium]|nr:MBL fold metallo-hydrolase [Candidatus Bipolaricaulota bacterium]